MRSLDVEAMCRVYGAPEVARYDAAFSNIWNTALDDQASRDLISEVAGSYEED